jgi:recombination protein RecT
MSNTTRSIKDLKPQPNTPAPADDAPLKNRIEHLLQSKKAAITAMLPRHLTADRLLKVATIAATTTPALAKCDVPSLVAAIGQCAQFGLEPNTVLGHAYLVPFNTKRKVNGVDTWVNSVQVIIGYRGLIDLARRSGQVVSIAAHEVRERDEFHYEYGLRESLKHIPAMKDRGEIVAFYAYAKLRDGGHCLEVMSREQVEEIRAESQGWQQAGKYNKQASHPWHKHFAEMGRKTAIRRLAKYLPLSVEFAKAIESDGVVANAPALDDGKTVDGELTWLNEADAAGFNDDTRGGDETDFDAPATNGPKDDGGGTDDFVAGLDRVPGSDDA